MLDFEQMAGRGGRDGQTNCLVLLLAEPWLFSSQRNAIDSSKHTRSKSTKVDDAVFDFAQSETCLRRVLAEMNEDNTPEGK